MSMDEILGSFLILLLVGLYFICRHPSETPWLTSDEMTIGRRGENLIYDVLKPLEKYGFKFLFNLYIPRGNNRDKTTEIDVVMIGRSGVFVIESKNYSGWIFGNDRNHYWTQILYHEKHRFYNPIFQNKSHLRWIRKYVGYDTPLHSLVVFSDRSTFKNVTYDPTETHLIHRKELRETVSNIIHDKASPQITPEKIQLIYDNLIAFEKTSRKTQRTHIEEIENNL